MQFAVLPRVNPNSPPTEFVAPYNSEHLVGAQRFRNAPRGLISSM